MTIVCNGVDITNLIAHGYTYEQEPQYGDTMTAMNGTDYTAKLRDRVKLTLPFVPLTEAQLHGVLQLFPAGSAYVTVQYYDIFTAANRTISMKYDSRSSTLAVRHIGGNTYYTGLVVNLIER